MTNKKLPKVGERYRSKTDIMLVDNIKPNYIGYKYDLGDNEFSMEYVIHISEFWLKFEPLPYTD